MRFFLVVFSLSLSPCLAAQDSLSARAEWITKWENSRNYTLEVLARVPDSNLHYRPTPDQMSVQEQAQHIAGNVFALSRRYLGYEPDDFDEARLARRLNADTLSRSALTGLLTEAYDFGAAAVSHLGEDRWGEAVPDFFAGPKTRRTIVYLLQDHATHHRAQLLVYLRLLGLKPPRYRGW